MLLLLANAKGHIHQECENIGFGFSWAEADQVIKLSLFLNFCTCPMDVTPSTSCKSLQVCACVIPDGRGLIGMGVVPEGHGDMGVVKLKPGIDQRMLHLLENIDRISDQSLWRKQFTINFESVTVS